MKTKIIQSIPAILALVIIGFRYFSIWCTDSISFCYSSWINQISLSITKPFYYFALYFLPIAIILILVQRSTFNSWLKFVAWALPLSILYIIMIPVNSNAYMDFFPFYRDDAARLAAGVVSVISLIFIIYKSVVARRLMRI